MANINIYSSNSDIQNTQVALYSVNQPLYASVYTNNLLPVLVTISEANSEKVISNLEMARISSSETFSVFVIDLQPFLSSYFTQDLVPLSSFIDALKEFTVSFSNGVDTTLTLEFYGIKESKEISESVVLANASNWNIQAQGKPTGVYSSDVNLNNWSPLFVPEGFNMALSIPIFTFNSDKTMKVEMLAQTVSDLTNSVVLTKEISEGEYVSIGEKEVIHQKFCFNDTPVLCFMNKEGYYEYLTFSKVFSKNTTIERENTFVSAFTRNTTPSQKNFIGATKTDTYTFTINASFKEIIEKLQELAVSKKVFLGKNIFPNQTESSMYFYSMSNWIEVELEYSPVFSSKNNFMQTSKQNLTVKIKNNILQ